MIPTLDGVRFLAPLVYFSFNLVIEKLMIPTWKHGVVRAPPIDPLFQSRNRETYDSNCNNRALMMVVHDIVSIS